MKKSYTIFGGFFAAAVLFIAGCGTDTVTPTGTVANPNVKTYDSVAVNESFDATSYSGMNILQGATVLRDDVTKDVQLIDNGGSPALDFYLRSGDLSVDHIGTKTRFALMYNDMTAAQFDTITTFPVGHTLASGDFTSDDSRIANPQVFNVPLTSFPVYCVWLEGKSTTINYYAIIQPKDMTTGLTGTKMIWRVRVNTAGQNDFRKFIPAS